MMSRNHLIVGACALEHAYVASVLIDRANIAPITAIQQAAGSYLGLNDLATATALTLPVYLAAYFFGTLLPDIDNPNSILGRIIHVPVKHRTWLHAIYLYLIIGAMRCLYLFLIVGFNTQESVHLVFAAILAFFKWTSPLCSWVFFGVFVHLFWDSFSAMGNCWFYKLFSDYREYPNGVKVKKKHKLKLYRAGEWSEYLLVFIIVAITIGSFVWISKGW